MNTWTRLPIINTSHIVFIDAYNVEELENNDSREVLKLHPFLAPIKVTVLPLVKKLEPKAQEVFDILSKEMMTEYDSAGNIGKRYRRQDAIGTPFCVTVDFDSLEDESVTVRDRDSMEQKRIKISDVVEYLKKQIVL